MPEPETFRSGFVALVGRPNVGKSTLLNALVGRKVSITARRAQTTRQRIVGIRHDPGVQMIFVDTPGMHRNQRKRLNRSMNQAAESALEDVDVAVQVVEAGRWTDEDVDVLERIQAHPALVLAVNKVDLIRPKERLLPYLAELGERAPEAEIVPLSAEKGQNVDRLLEVVTGRLPEGPAFYPADQVTDRPRTFLAGELIREKLTRYLGQEVPYELAVEVEKFEESEALIRVRAVILVSRPGQKAIVIGKGGQGLKTIGRAARLEMERLFERDVYLDLWVQVRKDWMEDKATLRRLGYDE